MSTCYLWNRNNTNSLILDNDKNINLKNFDLTFYTFAKYFRKLLVLFLGVMWISWGSRWEMFVWKSPSQVFKDLVTANLTNNSSFLLENDHICSNHDSIRCQRLFAPNLIVLGVVLERCLEENSCSQSSNWIKDSLLSKIAWRAPSCNLPN